MSGRLLPLPIVLFLLQACDGKAVVDIENQPPSAPTVSIGPNDPRTTDDLVAVIDAEARDADGDAVTYSYSWKQDGLPRTDLTTNTVPAAETVRGEEWEVTVTPNDGGGDGKAASATTNIVNTLPTVTVSFNPEVPATGDDLVAVATGLDDDGDAVTLNYEWMLDGGHDGTVTDTIPADRTEHGQRWAVTVTPVDIEGTGLPVTAEVEIANSAPEVLSVTLAPAAPYVTDDVVAVVEGYDADADAITYTYTFFVDGTEAQSGDSDTLLAGSFAKHQRVSVEVVPNDGFDDGEAFVSADAEVANSLPRAIRATIDPSTAYEISTLTCLPAGFSDADGDVESWTYAWSVNGTEVGTTATLDGASFNKGDAVTCAATPFDGEASGTAVTSALTVSNTAPVLASVTLSTYAPTENDTITVSLGAASDDDGDSITYSYDWYVNGSMVSTSSSLLPNRFKKADSIYVVVTPWDGADLGTPISSSTATGANTAPSVTTVTLTPTTVYTNDTLTAAVSATDLDGDTLSYTYDWYVDGVPRGSASSATLSGATYFDKGQDIYVVVTPNDGSVDGTTVTSSTVTVSNTAPTAPVVEVTPADAVEGDDLTCTVTTAASDADGDSMTYAFAWDVDGVDYASAADSAYSSVVDGADVGDGEKWTCEVTASDGTGSTSASESVTAGGGCSPAIDLGSGTSSIALGTNRSWSSTRTATFWTYQYGTNSTGAAFFNDEVTGTICPSWTIVPRSSTTGEQLASYWHSDASCGGSTLHKPGISNSVLTAGWTHIAVVVNGGTSTWYVDGVAEATYTTSSITPYARNRAMSMGSTGGYSGYLEGSIDDLAWWNRALSAAEVVSVMNDGPTAVSSTSLFGYWPMDEGSGSTFADESGNGATGSIGANTWTTRCK